MKIVFTGGGTGGHFYPIIAVAEELRQLAFDHKLIEAKLYYLSNTKYNPKALMEQGIGYYQIPAGKWRRYFSILNYLDLFKTAGGLIKALWRLFWIYPDVVFSKGGFASLPTVWAARFLQIPVFIHESDSRPGRANLSAASFAQRIAVSYPEAARFFPKEKTAITGNPIRKTIKNPAKEGAWQFLKLNPDWPVILILGGSQGSKKINDTILDILPNLLKDYQIIQQAGRENYEEVKARADYYLLEGGEEVAKRYKLYDYLNDTAMKMATGISSLIITRAGSGLFEIAAWQVPSIVIPIPEAISHDQRSNALAYGQTGAAVVIEENNLRPSILESEIRRILSQKDLQLEMIKACQNFGNPEAAKIIAKEIINISLKHEAIE